MSLTTTWESALQNSVSWAVTQLLKRWATFDLDAVKKEVLDIWEADLSGKEKKELIYDKLCSLIKEQATWLIYIAIELAYVYVRDTVKKQGEPSCPL